jgi:hypothetical protein
MTDRVVFLNLADMHENGLVQTSAENLRRKFAPKSKWQSVTQAVFGGTIVDIVDLFDLIEKNRRPTGSSGDLTMMIYHLFSYLNELNFVKEKCKSAEKILRSKKQNDKSRREGFSIIGKIRKICL